MGWTEADRAAMEALLGPQGVVADAVDLARYAVDWTGVYRGHPPFVLRPASTAEVAAVVRYAYDRALPLVPQSGNTGLVGGGVPFADEVVLSLDRMQRIRAFDPDVPAVTCEAGVTLERLERLAAEHRLRMPVDLGARGSACAGGLVATNAGGMRFVRDGPIGASLLGLEVVLADGRILSSLRTLRKDNTGYRWRDLFVGSEGTLGVITAVVFLLRPQAAARRTALLPLGDLAEVEPTIRSLRASLGAHVGALELVGRAAADLVQREMPDVRPLPVTGSAYLLLEIEGSDGERLEADLAGALAALDAQGLAHVADQAVLAQSEAESRALWQVREAITEAIRRTGSSRKFDVSVPPRSYADVVRDLEADLAARWPGLSLLTFGHAADGNLHLNIVGPEPAEGWEAVDDVLYTRVLAADGSISAEHGVGRLKRDHLSAMRSPEELAWMREIKHLMDPRGILNPGKVLPDS